MIRIPPNLRRKSSTLPFAVVLGNPLSGNVLGHRVPVPRVFLLSVVCATLCAISVVGQNATSSLSLSGEWKSWEWNVSISLQLDPVVVTVSETPPVRVPLDSALTNLKRSGVKGADLYKATGLYSGPFKLSEACRAIRIPISYEVAFGPIGRPRSNPSSTVFLDITDESGQTVLARMLGHQAVSPESTTTDSSFAETLLLNRESSLWNLEGKRVSLEELSGHTV